jgi:hypothetical protein
MERRGFRWPVLLRTLSIHARFAFVAVVTVVMSMCGAADGQTNTITTTTTNTNTHTPPLGVCPAVNECLSDTVFSTCWRVLASSFNADVGIPFNQRSPQKQFFLDLISPTCSSNGCRV